MIFDCTIISSLYADLYNLPPALFTVGTLDAFIDDAPALARVDRFLADCLK